MDFGHWECDLVLGHKTKDDSQNLPDVMVSVQFILAIGGRNILTAIFSKLLVKNSRLMKKSGEHGKIFKN
ncbi:hypothetical protein [Lactobacillus delbrueckii]|uniref:hypothetical protein n=1 Tax=Lactobacillus delbrueckii TaxID=1584 RepID=UPI0037C6D9DF